MSFFMTLVFIMVAATSVIASLTSVLNRSSFVWGCSSVNMNSIKSRARIFIHNLGLMTVYTPAIIETYDPLIGWYAPYVNKNQDTVVDTFDESSPFFATKHSNRLFLEDGWIIVMSVMATLQLGFGAILFSAGIVSLVVDNVPLYSVYPVFINAYLAVYAVLWTIVFSIQHRYTKRYRTEMVLKKLGT